MSSCDLEIVLEPRDSYAAGSTVEGLVGVTVNRDCTCRKLTVSLRWRTHGRGHPQTHVVDLDILYNGELTADERHVFPFSLTIPDDADQTYHGTLLNVDWDVYATADISWARDPSVSQDIVVRLQPDAPYDKYQPQSPDLHNSRALNLPVAGASAIFMVVCGGLLVQFITSEGDLCSSFCGLIGLGMGGLACASVLFHSVRSALAERRLGPVHVDLPLQAFPVGSHFPVSVSMSPLVPVDTTITATLTAKEVVVTGSGTNKTTHSHEIHRSEEVLFQGMLQPGVLVSHTTELTIPSDAAPTFEARSNKILWTLEIHVDVPRWPDWAGSYELIVRP